MKVPVLSLSSTVVSMCQQRSQCIQLFVCSVYNIHLLSIQLNNIVETHYILTLCVCVLSCHIMYNVSKFGTHDPLSKQLNTVLVRYCVIWLKTWRSS